MSLHHNFDIREEDRQAIILALAQLTFRRPGWLDYMRTIAGRLEGADMFEDFLSFGPDSRRAHPPEPALEDVMRVVTEHYGMTAEALRSRRKPHAIVRSRQVGMYLAREATRHSFNDIGEFFGGREHSTVIHAVEQVADRMLGDDEFRQTVEDLLTQIRRHDVR